MKFVIQWSPGGGSRGANLLEAVGFQGFQVAKGNVPGTKLRTKWCMKCLGSLVGVLGGEAPLKL